MVSTTRRAVAYSNSQTGFSGVALYEGDGFKGVQTDGEQTFWDKMVTRGRDTRRVLMRKAA